MKKSQKSGFNSKHSAKKVDEVSFQALNGTCRLQVMKLVPDGCNWIKTFMWETPCEGGITWKNFRLVFEFSVLRQFINFFFFQQHLELIWSRDQTFIGKKEKHGNV